MEKKRGFIETVEEDTRIFFSSFRCRFVGNCPSHTSFFFAFVRSLVEKLKKKSHLVFFFLISPTQIINTQYIFEHFFYKKVFLLQKIVIFLSFPPPSKKRESSCYYSDLFGVYLCCFLPPTTCPSQNVCVCVCVCVRICMRNTTSLIRPPDQTHPLSRPAQI